MTHRERLERMLHERERADEIGAAEDAAALRWALEQLGVRPSVSIGVALIGPQGVIVPSPQIVPQNTSPDRPRPVNPAA